MKKFLGSLIAVMLLVAVAPVLAVDTGVGITPDIVTEDFAPLIWMCDERVVIDDMVESGRIDGCPVYDKDDNLKGYELIERKNNYAFEGEKIEFVVLVMDKNGINKIKDVFMTVGDVGEEDDIEVNCVELLGHRYMDIRDSCSARIGEEWIVDFDNQLMRYYECTLTVETPDSMFGEHWITAQVCDLDDLCNTMDENEYWFLNPVVALSVDGDLIFDDVRPGTQSYSSTILVGNDADEGSGVRLDMFITGTDFYDSSNSGAQCPTTNQLSLSNFRYFATSGAYSTQNDLQTDDNDLVPKRNRDAEGYVNIHWANSFSTALYDEAEIIQNMPKPGPYYSGNILPPGAEIAMTFKLSLPEPCNGDFDTGSIYFWGEAI